MEFFVYDVDICFTGFGTALTTILPILSRNESGRFGALKSDSLEMHVPSQGHYGFHSFLVVD